MKFISFQYVSSLSLITVLLKVASAAKVFELPDMICTHDTVAMINAVRIHDKVLLSGEEDHPGAGAMWLKEPIDVRAPFTTRFTFSIHPYGRNAGDGIAFVIQGNRSDMVGSAGSAMGYGGGAFKGIAVEFDVYRNAEIGDVDGNHVSVHVSQKDNFLSAVEYDNSVALWSGLDLEGVGVQLNSGRPVEVEIRYDPVQSALVIDMEGTTLGTARMYLSKVFEGPNALVGFTASAGSSGAQHYIHRWSMQQPFENVNIDACFEGFIGVECLPDCSMADSVCHNYDNDCLSCACASHGCAYTKETRTCSTWDGFITESVTSDLRDCSFHRRKIPFLMIGMIGAAGVALAAALFTLISIRNRNMTRNGSYSYGAITSYME